MRIAFLLLPILFACQAPATSPEPDAPACEFRFVSHGHDCQEWGLNPDGSCYATCFPIYSDAARCPAEALPKSSEIRLLDGRQYVDTAGALSYAYRGPLSIEWFPVEHNMCRYLRGEE